LVGLVLALEERNRLPEAERRRLDAEVRAQIDDQRGLDLLRLWLARAPSLGLRGRTERVRASLVLMGWLLAVAGVFLGWGTAAALLSIEVHEGRINIVLVVAVLVWAPLLALLMSLMGWLWSFWWSSRNAARSDPLRARSLSDLVRSATLGRIVLGILTPTVRQDVEVVLGRMTGQRLLYSRVARTQLTRWSQTLGFGFGVGALGATLVFVAFTDLAFGWSTTLEIAAADVHPWVRLMASPWAGLWPAASPPLELVESTRFFRVAADDHDHLIDPILFGGWWPFLVMSIATYCVLPRAVVSLLLWHWHTREIGRAAGLTPGVDRLVDRLTTPIVEGQAITAEKRIGRGETGRVHEVDRSEWMTRAGEIPLLIRWAELLGDAEIDVMLGGAPIRILDAGGSRSLEHDEMVASEAAAATAAVAVLVRGYEPPVLDVLDFLALLRTKLGADARLCVFLLGAKDSDLGTWQRKLASLGDSRLVVSRWESGHG
jgi:hypothetical protein